MCWAMRWAMRWRESDLADAVCQPRRRCSFECITPIVTSSRHRRAASASRDQPGGHDMDSPYKLYNDALAAANKALGKDGQLPKPRVDLLKTLDEGNKTLAGLSKQRQEMEKTVVDVEAAVAKIKGAAKQYGDLVDGNDFGLDEKDPKNKKLIASVTKTMLDALQGVEDNMDIWSGWMDKLDKVLTDLSRLDK
jgi:hypothetical protein